MKITEYIYSGRNPFNYVICSLTITNPNINNKLNKGNWKREKEEIIKERKKERKVKRNINMKECTKNETKKVQSSIKPGKNLLTSVYLPTHIKELRKAHFLSLVALSVFSLSCSL